MCRICGKYLCPSACPSYEGASAEGGRAIGRCTLCGVTLREYEYIKYSCGNPYCFECYLILQEEIN